MHREGFPTTAIVKDDQPRLESVIGEVSWVVYMVSGRDSKFAELLSCFTVIEGTRVSEGWLSRLSPLFSWRVSGPRQFEPNVCQQLFATHVSSPTVVGLFVQ